jgi:type VI secretion system protein ImpG
MNRNFLEKYNDELLHLRGAASEFAEEFPKIAGRLALEKFECPDPYVERLLEGFAFLTARIQLKFDAEFPRFTQAILETVYPHFLAPTPSMCVVRFDPDPANSALAEGITLKRGEPLASLLAPGERTACEYRTAAPITLWPLRLTRARYLTREVNTLSLPQTLVGRTKAALVFQVKILASLTARELKLDRLPVFLRGAGDLPMRLYEQIFAHGREILVRPAGQPDAVPRVISAGHLHQLGFDDEEALLPYSGASFQGYRLLQEYFAFPARYLFFELSGLQPALQGLGATELEIAVLFDQEDLNLEGRVDADNLGLFCAPAINLFPKRADRIHLDETRPEYQVLVDRTRPLDFEVYRVASVTGHGVQADDQQPFTPFYTATDLDTGSGAAGAYYVVRREPRLITDQEKRRGRRSSYGGSEVYLSLVDAKSAPFRSDLRELAIQTWCTNRDLPLQMPQAKESASDFTLQTSAPIVRNKLVAGPTPPKPSNAEGEIAWRAISHLCLNYLSLTDTEGGTGAQGLRDLLKLYADTNDPQIRKQVEGLVSISTQPVTRRLRIAGPITFARGIEITLLFDESLFEGTGVFLLGAVLERFFARYVTINSFTETVVATQQRGVIMRWPARVGTQHIL